MDPFFGVSDAERSGAFDLQVLYRNRHQELQAVAQREPKEVCVIGAGMAGLVAAYELHLLGQSVTVLEASSR